MNVLLDDLVDGFFHKIQDSLVPTIEVATQKATHELKNRLKTPPPSVDLLYLTDRLIVSSQPAVSSNPTYTDNGRDNPLTRVQLSKPVSGPETGNSKNRNDNYISDKELILQELSFETRREEKKLSFEAPKTSNREISEGTANLSESGVKFTDETTTATKSCLDISHTPKGTAGNPKLEDSENLYRNANKGMLSASICTNEDAIYDSNDVRSSPPTASGKNSPAIMTSFLDKRHGPGHYLAFSLVDEAPDDRTLLLFRRQIVQLGWWSPCAERSETPSISNLLKTCYAIHAYLELHAKNVALIYCSNGKTRTAIAVACYLKFAGAVDHCQEGFFHFLEKSGLQNPEITWMQLPPSLRLFFEQFDTALSIGGYPNRKPLRLRAIALQGVPVEDKPCLDIWDSSQRHVYSSHPELWDRNEISKKNSSKSSQWIDEEGFYKVDVCLDGDFLIVFRFGGDFAKDTAVHDPSKVLFRYTNNTGFLAGGCPYELPPTKVDLTKRYALHLDHEDFLVTLIFQADWEKMEDAEREGGHAFPEWSLERKDSEEGVSSEQIWRSHDRQACEDGLRVIFQHHSARPDASDVKKFLSLRDERLFERCAGHLVCLALQLTNFNHGRTNDLLLSSPSFAWWRLHPHNDTSKGKTIASSGLEFKTERGSIAGGESGKRVQNMLDMLNDIDVSKNLDSKDIVNFKEFNARQKLQTKLLNSQCTPKRRNSSAFRWNQPGIDICSDDVGWMVPGITHPHPGDIFRGFGASCSAVDSSFRLPMLQSLSSPRVPHHPDRNSLLHCGRGNVGNPHDRQRDLSTQVSLQMQHTGLTSSCLLELVRESQQWDGLPSRTSLKAKIEKVGLDVVKDSATESKESSMNRKSKEQKEKEWEEARNAEEKEKSRKRSAEDQRSQDRDEQPPEQGEDETDSLIPLKNDPEYAKYFKMLKVGMPLAQVEHAMKRDKKDTNVLKLDPEKSLDEQIPEQPENDGGDIALKEDPEYEKYFRMVKMGLPKDAVRNALIRDGKDRSVIDLDPTKSFNSQLSRHSICDDPPLQDDPDYQKYFRMLKMGMPEGAVKNALVRDGKDPSIIDLDPEKSLRSQTLVKEDTGVPLKDDPEYRKYFKMIAMGLPVDAVKNALMRDGKDPSVMDLDPNKSVQFQLEKNGKKDAGIPLKDDPEYAKYFKMLDMGLPLGAVKNALERDGKDPHVLDLDPEKSVAYQLKESAASKKSPTKKKKKVRRKKIYWNPIDPGKLKEDSMWHIVRDVVNMNKLNYDQKEFEDLFTESADPKDVKKRKKPEKVAKKLVQVIDPKRSMNGGIILARLKIDYSRIADIVNKMERSKFDSTQLSALKEFLPDADERRGLIGYMENSKTKKDVLYADLSETEKYMYTMIDVAGASEKMDAMLFRCVFKNRFDDVNAGINTLNSACDQLRSSEKLRKLMAMILTVVNEINTGGEGNMAIGFTLDALLKLNEAKAFDKKTSVLHYVVKLVKKNDSGLLNFGNDISSVIPAESVLLDSLANEMKALVRELVGVHKTVQTEAERLEEAGELKPMTLEDLKEQRTTVRQVGNVSQFNKMDHHTGRTPMERFMVNARCSCDNSTSSIEDVRKKYLALLEYFGEDKNMPTGDFFGILRRFMREFQKAVDQVEAIEKKEAKERKRAAARAAKAAAKNEDRQIGRTKKGRRVRNLQRAPKGQLANMRKNKDTGDAAATENPQNLESTQDSKQQTRSDLLSAMAAAAASRKGLQAKDPSTSKQVTKINSDAITGEKDKKVEKKTCGVETGVGYDSSPGNQDTGSEVQKFVYNESEPSFDLCTQSIQSEKEKVQKKDTAFSKSPGAGEAGGAGAQKDTSISGDPHAQAASKQQEDILEVHDHGLLLTNSDTVSQTRNVTVTVLAQQKQLNVSAILVNDKRIVGVTGSHEIVETRVSKSSEANAIGAEEQVPQVTNLSKEGEQAKPSSVTVVGTHSTMGFALDKPSENAVREEPNSAFKHRPVHTTEVTSKEANDEPTGASMDIESLERLGKKSTESQSEIQNEKARQIHIGVSDVRDSETQTLSPAVTVENRSTLESTSVPHTNSDQSSPIGAFQSERSVTTAERNTLPLSSKDETQMTAQRGPLPGMEGVSSVPSSLQPKQAPSERMESEQNKALTNSFDDVSVADSIPKQTTEVRMSKTWTDGEDITNWMPWAGEVIKACDSDSVVGFEIPRDLNDGMEFDDDSTVASSASFASNYDDLSVTSGFNTPGKITPLQSTTTLPFEPYFDYGKQSPKQFFGGVEGRLQTSLSFNDSRSTTVNPSHLPFQRFDTAKLSGGTSTPPRHYVGLDSGLSFGADVGFDGGLGGFGAISNIDDNDDNGMHSSKTGTESKRKNAWFPWGGGGGGGH